MLFISPTALSYRSLPLSTAAAVRAEIKLDSVGAVSVLAGREKTTTGTFRARRPTNTRARKLSHLRVAAAAVGFKELRAERVRRRRFAVGLQCTNRTCVCVHVLYTLSVAEILR